jgi:SAM-dependent methyltransferase
MIMPASAPEEGDWEWDETLYLGSAAYYAKGRVPYQPELLQALAAELGLDGTGRLLDCGCGPGSLTLLLAPQVAEAVGIDADPAMIAEARLRAERAGIGNVSWRQLRAEELPSGLGEFRVVTFAQSFHWVDQRVVARAVRGMLGTNGVCVHVFATTHEGEPGDDELPRPRPPRARIAGLIEEYLGPVRRAGQGVLPYGPPAYGAGAMRAAGFTGPGRVEVGQGTVHLRTEDEIVASVFSLSGAAPHLFGDRAADFERDLRAVLLATAPDGQFAERMRGTAFEVWRPPAG